MVFFIGCRLISLNGIQISEKENVYVHNLFANAMNTVSSSKGSSSGVLFYYDY